MRSVGGDAEWDSKDLNEQAFGPTIDDVNIVYVAIELVNYTFILSAEAITIRFLDELLAAMVRGAIRILNQINSVFQDTRTIQCYMSTHIGTFKWVSTHGVITRAPPSMQCLQIWSHSQHNPGVKLIYWNHCNTRGEWNGNLDGEYFASLQIVGECAFTYDDWTTRAVSFVSGFAQDRRDSLVELMASIACIGININFMAVYMSTTTHCDERSVFVCLWQRLKNHSDLKNSLQKYWKKIESIWKNPNEAKKY